MPQGKPAAVPDDGLTTKQRRNRPLVIVHTGDGKGKSTAAFGLALRGWNQGWRIGVFQFVKSAKWRIGEQTVLERLGQLHDETGEGGPVEWHKMGSGWSWTRKQGDAEARVDERNVVFLCVLFCANHRRVIIGFFIIHACTERTNAVFLYLWSGGRQVEHCWRTKGIRRVRHA